MGAVVYGLVRLGWVMSELVWLGDDWACMDVLAVLGLRLV
jgi:hypothetical protein